MDELDEKGAQKLIEALAPSVELSVKAGKYRKSLAKVMGIVDERIVKRFQYTDKPDRPVTYEFIFPCQWSLSDMMRPNIARQWNNALGEELFRSVFMDSLEAVIVMIAEKDMPKLLANPNKGRLPEILASRLEESGVDSHGNPRDNLLSRASRKLLRLTRW